MNNYTCPMCQENDTLHHSTGWTDCLSCGYSNLISEFREDNQGHFFAEDEPFNDERWDD